MKRDSSKPRGRPITRWVQTDFDLKVIDHTHQPTKAELEADVSIPCDPDELLRAAIDFIPPKRRK